jgi:uncharacterized damage-inducible protein DinB
MIDTRTLADQIWRTFHGPSWHGPALEELLRGVLAADAAARPLPGAHSIWELVLHAAVWADVARVRLTEVTRREIPGAEDWPAVGATTPEAWTAAKSRLETSYHTLVDAVAALDSAELDALVRGRDHTVGAMLYGVVEHGCYHGGQIALLKRALTAAR